jgi:sugar phosphate permease
MAVITFRLRVSMMMMVPGAVVLALGMLIHRLRRNRRPTKRGGKRRLPRPLTRYFR